PVRRQLAGDAAAEFARKFRMCLLVRRKPVIPGTLERCAPLFRVPAFVNVLGNLERRIPPTDRRASRRDLLGPERLPVRLGRPGALGGSLADHGLAADEAGFVRYR